MLCQNCGCELREGASFCVKCGTKVEPEVTSQPTVSQNMNMCSNCGAPLQAGARFCIACGTPAISLPSAEVPLSRDTVSAMNMPNQNSTQPVPVYPSPAMPASMEEEKFQFKYLGGGRALSYVFGNPLYLTVNADQVTMTVETTTSFFVFEIPCNEIIGFELKRKFNIGIAILGITLLLAGTLFALSESIFSILWIICGIAVLINSFPVSLYFHVSDGRKIGQCLKKPKAEQIDAANRLSAMMDIIVRSQPKVTGITKKQSQIKRYKK